MTKRRVSEQERAFRGQPAGRRIFPAGAAAAGSRRAAALDYLERRGLTRADASSGFELGYAPKGWDHLLGSMTRKKIASGAARKGRVWWSRARTAPGYYDRFRDRIIFPIHDEHARVVGFGGRVMDDSTPKYLNSPETPVYTKRRVLYGLHRAKESCRTAGSVFIVEGYLDLIALHQHGIRNAVATLGTALDRRAHPAADAVCRPDGAGLRLRRGRDPFGAALHRHFLEGARGFPARGRVPRGAGRHPHPGAARRARPGLVHVPARCGRVPASGAARPGHRQLPDRTAPSPGTG
ncbi:MAG: toprim domain-containing protein [Desulfobacterales bacterium]|nr:toprim domain-containing protein [Desulfobacterales bacterium]